ncbi:MAG: AgmX/PglI C-terminal domain-containing protein [Gammaproteobacteria bacterium]|jgi:protein TonB|nr:AgmX/PglI C-terminal domain-containing protein [Gammaproteobacteria bacterium]
MSIAALPYYRLYELPWSPGAEAEERFRRILRNCFIAYLVLGVLIPLLPAPEVDPARAPEIPERVVQLIVEQPKPVPPPKVEPVEQPKPEPELAKVEPKPVPVARVKPEPVPVDRRQEARDKARKSGLLAFADDLADLRDDKAVTEIAGAQAVTGAVGEAARNERSLLTSRVGQGSGGINTAAMSRNTGGAGLGSRSTTRVQSAVASMASGPDAPPSPSGKAGRSREEIEMVFDQNKGAIYSLYNRALRSNPALQGKLVLRLTIEPSGQVSAVEVVSSELNDEELERKLIQRVRMFTFLSKDVPAVTTTKPIDFFPA